MLLSLCLKVTKKFTDDELKMLKSLREGLIDASEMGMPKKKTFHETYLENLKTEFKDLLNKLPGILESVRKRLTDFWDKVTKAPEFGKKDVPGLEGLESIEQLEQSLSGLQESIDEALKKRQETIEEFNDAYLKSTLSQYQYDKLSLKKRYDLYARHVKDKEKLDTWFKIESEKLDKEAHDRFVSSFKGIGEQIEESLKTWKDKFQSFRNDFKTIVDDLADALVSFVATGKFQFKDLVNSILSDLARIMTRRVIVEPIMRAFDLFLPTLYGQKTARTAITKAAKGGIVDKPTLFAFQHGTGLMGEAGPEAILPLKRMPSGNLGVEASGVNVKVYNYSGMPAQVSEARNAQGGRDIKVIVGELAGRNIMEGGALAQVLQRQYGLQPAVIGRS